MVRHPRVNIVLPLLIVTIFSYHTLSNLTITWPTRGYLGNAEFLNDSSVAIQGAQSFNMTMVQIIVQSIDEDSNILSKKSLLEFLAFQNKLTDGISHAVSVNSFFKLWDNSLEVLYRDKFPLHTMNAKRLSIPRYSLLGTWKVNGFISSATGCMISLLAEDQDFPRLQSVLQKNLAYLGSIANITTFHSLQSHELKGDSYETGTGQALRLFFTEISREWNFVTLLIHSALLFHLFMSMRVLRNSVKSITGITVAIVVQVAFVICSSTTITRLLFKQSNDVIPIRLLTWPVILLLTSSQLRTLECLSHRDSKEDLSGHFNGEDSIGPHPTIRTQSEAERRFILLFSRSQLKSIKLLLVFSVVVVLITPFSIAATHFLLFSLWLGQFLDCTLFTAIVSLDYRGRDENILTDKSNGDDLLLDDDVVSQNNRLGYKRFFRIASSRAFSITVVGIYLLLCKSTFSLAPHCMSLLGLLASMRSHVTSLSKSQPKAIFDQYFVAEKALSLGELNNIKASVVNLNLTKELLVVKCENENAITDLLRDETGGTFDLMSANSFYKLNFTYAVQFVALIVLVLCCTLLGLQKLVQRQDNDKIDLFSRSCFEDVSELSLTKKTDGPDIKDQESETIDHANSGHFHMKELYKNGHGLDIMTIATSKAPFIVSAGLDHKVLVWSPLVNPVPAPTRIPLQRKFWPLTKILLSDDGNYIAFFGQSGHITTWSRRHMKFIWEIKLKNTDGSRSTLLEALFRKVTMTAFKRKRSKPSAKQSEPSASKKTVVTSEYVPVTGGIDASYENPRKMSTDGGEMNELVFVSSRGLIYSIQDDGTMRVEKLTPSEHGLISCKLLSSPRINDRLVICDEVGDIYIATVINNNWRPNKLKVNYDRILKPPSATCELTDFTRLNHNEVQHVETDNTIELVQFVGLILRVLGRTADLFDAQTGTVVKTFQIDNFKPNTLRVFHDSPTHCKFCGSASVASFSVAYTDVTSNRVTMHTYKLESRTKTSICLRVERDLREIRCLGMESAVETVHYIYDVENWCVTDSNILIGLRKVPQVLEPSTGGSSSMARSLVNDDEDGILLRKKTAQKSDDVQFPSHLIHNIWEGWTMSAMGKISSHKIPVGVNGLVTDRLGPLSKFGAKAVVVGFANIMDMFYVGHESLIFSTDTNDGSKEETGLRFVNNRRDRYSHRKLPLNYTNL